MAISLQVSAYPRHALPRPRSLIAVLIPSRHTHYSISAIVMALCFGFFKFLLIVIGCLILFAFFVCLTNAIVSARLARKGELFEAGESLNHILQSKPSPRNENTKQE